MINMVFPTDVDFISEVTYKCIEEKYFSYSDDIKIL